MQPEESIEIDRAGGTGRQRRSRNRDVRTQPVVRRLAVRHDDVQRVGGAALKEADQRLAARAPLSAAPLIKLGAERGAAEKARAQPHRHQGERTGLHEYSAIHILTP